MRKGAFQIDLDALTQQAAARLLSTTARSLRDWEAAGEAVPRNSDGSYPGPALVAWYSERGGETLDANRERARKDKEMADKLSLENQLRRGELSVTKQIVSAFGGLVAAARSRLIQIPDALGQFCDARYATVIVAEARRRIYEALAELAADVGADLDAAADADGERVGGREPEALERGERRTGSMAN
jgi:hypothetical protein